MGTGVTLEKRGDVVFQDRESNFRVSKFKHTGSTFVCASCIDEGNWGGKGAWIGAAKGTETRTGRGLCGDAVISSGKVKIISAE